jgi:hypothetical protein
MPLALETAHDLARTPRGMRVAHRKYLHLDRRVRAARTGVRAARLIRQILLAGGPSLQPLVARVRMNAEPAAQLAPVRSFLHRKRYKLTPLFHN